MIRNGQALNLRAISHDIPDAILAMILSPYDFELTGSRAFHANGPLSDWDFFVKLDEEVIHFLMDLGFEEEYDNPYHGDVNAAKVYKLDSSPSIHVQLVNNVDIKELAQIYIRKYLGAGAFYSWEKSDRKAVWLMVQTILKETMNGK